MRITALRLITRIKFSIVMPRQIEVIVAVVCRSVIDVIRVCRITGVLTGISRDAWARYSFPGLIQFYIVQI
jgi:hypothetical protein